METSFAKVLLFAGFAAIGNAIFVYGQRSAAISPNPYLFMCGSVAICAIMFIAASLLVSSSDSIAYLRTNWWQIFISATGFFITFIGFYLMYSRVGAQSYTVYAVLSILTTSVFVGMFIFREDFNFYHIISVGFSILAVCFFGYAQLKNIS